MKTADPVRKPPMQPQTAAGKPLSAVHAARAAIRLLTERGVDLTPANYRQAWILVGGPPIDGDLEQVASSAVGLLGRYAPTDTISSLVNLVDTQRWSEAQAILTRLEKSGPHHPPPTASVQSAPGAGAPSALSQSVASEKHRAGASGDPPVDTRRSNSQLRKVNAELVEIVGALCSSFEAISEPDSWIASQVRAVREAVSDGSDRRSLAAARALLEQALDAQHDISLTRRDSLSALRDLLPNLVEQMSQLGERSGDFGATLSGHMEAISQADSLEGIAERVRSLVADAHSMQESVGDAQRGLQSSSERAQSLESQVVRLEQELAQASERLLIDHLTRSANRAGLEQAYLREIVPVRDESRLLAVGLLDIDDFKRVNDLLGHHAGDGALQHLARLLQSKVRPCDTVARYGGEEFVLLLPGLDVEEARELLMKVQRELTRDVYLYDEKKVFITFSAGATMVRPDDSLESSLLRADEAMYQAKNAGKNCVAIV
jgi:diguanylate cyclase